MKKEQRDAMLPVMLASSIVKNIRPECMNAAETMGSILDALTSRDAEIERLRKTLEEWEAFIRTTLGCSDLFTAIEAYEFECEAGPLKNCSEWIELKKRLGNQEA